jgi:hypothetical protein
MAKLRDSIDVERRGEVVRLSWDHRGSHPRTMIFEGMLVTVLLLLSFGWLLAESSWKQPQALKGRHNSSRHPQRSTRGFDGIGSQLANYLYGCDKTCCALSGPIC